jgi:nitronate monooxygenase
MTRLLDVLGTELPILQAPMAGVQDAALAIAVGSAGALGAIPAAMLDADGLRAEVARVPPGMKLNLNFFSHATPAADPDREARWRARLAPYYVELGLAPPSDAPAAPGRAPFDAAFADVVAELRPAVVSFHFGLPAPDLLARVKAAGAVVLSSATTLAEARWLEARGVDAIIAQGLEAGGHRGHFLSDDLTEQSGTFALVPQLVRALSVPVIAAGGIADARGVRAALALGAEGVQVGTAFLLVPEATTRPLHRAALASDRAIHTALTNVVTGRPARGIVNRLIREVGPLSPDAPAFPFASAAVLPLRAEAERRGSADFSTLWAGQGAGACRAVPAREIVEELAAGLR